MFWKKRAEKKRAEAQLISFHQAELNAMVQSVLEAAPINFAASPQLNQTVVSTFLFGLIHAHGMRHDLKPHQVYALALLIFVELSHNGHMAAEIAQECFMTLDSGRDDTVNAIIHRGINAHAAYLRNDIKAIADDLSSVLAHFAA